MAARSPSSSPGAVSTGWEAADASSVGSSHSLLSVASSLKNESIPLSKNSCQCCHDCGDTQGLNLGISCLNLSNSNFSTDAWSEHKRCGSPAGVSYINRKIGVSRLPKTVTCRILDNCICGFINLQEDNCIFIITPGIVAPQLEEHQCPPRCSQQKFEAVWCGVSMKVLKNRR